MFPAAACSDAEAEATAVEEHIVDILQTLSGVICRRYALFRSSKRIGGANAGIAGTEVTSWRYTRLSLLQARKLLLPTCRVKGDRIRGKLGTHWQGVVDGLRSALSQRHLIER